MSDLKSIERTVRIIQKVREENTGTRTEFIKSKAKNLC